MSTDKGCRSVRIHLAMKDGPLPRVIRQVLPVIGNETSHTYVENMNEADLVIFTEVCDIESGYSKEKSYAHLQTSGAIPHLPENCVTFGGGLLDLINVINKAREKLKPLVTKVVEVVEEVVPLRPDALRILVIEDTPKHQASAKAGLAGHKLTVVTGYEEAMKIIGSEKFDVVLTDLQMPMSSTMLNPEAFKLGELVHYGILLMIEAAHQGAKHVAVVTDISNHAQHNNWLIRALDRFLYPMQIEGAKVLMMHAPMRQDANGERVKDWAEALNRLMKA